MAKIRAGSRIASWMFGIASLALFLGYLTIFRTRTPGSTPRVTLAVVSILGGGLIYAFQVSRMPRCAECGARFSQAHRGQEVCLRCRDRRLAPVAVKAGKRKSVLLSLASYAILGLFLGCLLTIILVREAGWELGHAVTVSVVAIALVVPAWIALFVAGLVAWYKVSTSEKGMIARARKRAKEEGETIRVGPHLVWYAGDVDPSALVSEQREVIRSRAEALLGETSEPEKPLRIFLFNRRDDFASFLRPFLPHAWNFDGVLLASGTVAISAEDVPSYVVDVKATLRSYFCGGLLDQRGIPFSVLWLRIGIARRLTFPGDAEIRRIDRKMAAAMRRGNTLGTELFALTPARTAKLIRNWYNPEAFREYAQTLFQSTSMFHFLIEGGASPARLAALRGFLSDLKGKGEVEDLFATRFGFRFEEFVKRWREEVESKGQGSHAPAPGAMAEKIRSVVGPFIQDPQRLLMDRVAAIRDLGMGGYLEGAGALIDLLRASGDVPESEIIWALEEISGRTCGADPEAWTAWLRDEPMLSESHA